MDGYFGRPSFFERFFLPGALTGLARSRRGMAPELDVQFVDPTGFSVGEGVGVGDVGFDVQHRRAVEQIDPAQM